MLERLRRLAGWLGSLARAPTTVGAIGFLFWRRIVNQLAVRIPDLGAGAPFYGRQPSAEDTAKIKRR